jgi:hypothetical protein
MTAAAGPGSPRRVQARTHATGGPPVDAPPRRAGRRCGYEHRDELLVANRALGKALTALARDPDPAARAAGAGIAARVAQAVARAAAEADAVTSRSRRIAAELEQQLPKLERRLARARSRVADGVSGECPSPASAQATARQADT